MFLFWNICKSLIHDNTSTSSLFDLTTVKRQKQPPRSVPRKRCSENMQQIYGRTPMLKYEFNKVAKQLDNLSMLT